MLLHIARSRPRPFLLRTYQIAARIEASPAELAAIHAHRLDRFEIFADPHRDYLLSRAQAARERQKALGWFVHTPEDLGTLWLETGRELTLLARARFSFRITIGHLVAGVVITNRSLNAIRRIEHVLADSVDAVAAIVAAALDFQHAHEDVLAPGTATTATAPNDWTSQW